MKIRGFAIRYVVFVVAAACVARRRAASASDTTSRSFTNCVRTYL